MSLRQFVLRAGVIEAGLAAGLLAAAKPIVAVLGLLSLINTADLLGRLSPAEDGMERVLYSALGLIVALVALGLVLNELPGHLTRTSWTIGWASVSMLALYGVFFHRRPRPVSDAVPFPLAGVVAVAMVALGTVLAVVVADAGLRKLNKHPILALSVDHWTSRTARIDINASNIAGSFRLQAQADSRVASGGSGLQVTLSAGEHEDRSLTVSLPPARSYWLISLTPTRTSKRGLTRTLILTRRPGTSTPS